MNKWTLNAKIFFIGILLSVLSIIILQSTCLECMFVLFYGLIAGTIIFAVYVFITEKLLKRTMKEKFWALPGMMCISLFLFSLCNNYIVVDDKITCGVYKISEKYWTNRGAYHVSFLKDGYNQNYVIGNDDLREKLEASGYIEVCTRKGALYFDIVLTIDDEPLSTWH